jgi:light-harvesting complex 1 beta chain
MTNLKTNNERSASFSHEDGEGMLFMMLFVVFLAVALVGHLLTMNWRSWLPGAEDSLSTVEGVKSSVYTVISQLT